MEPKQFKLIRSIRKTEDVTKLTPKIEVLRLMMERHQNQYSEYDYAIVDEHGKPAELADFLASELSHPVAKARQVKEEKYKAKVVKRLKNCV